MSLCAERSSTVQYSFDDCFTAAVLAIDTLPKYSITASDFTTGSIDVNISASYNSYGERMIIEISDTGVACHVKITTSPKAPYLLWRGKCEKNNAEFFAALSKALQNFSTRDTASTVTAGSTPSVEARLQKLKSSWTLTTSLRRNTSKNVAIFFQNYKCQWRTVSNLDTG